MSSRAPTGLPSDYKLDLPPGLDGPADIPDYLDQELRVSRNKQEVRQAPEPPPAQAQPQHPRKPPSNPKPQYKKETLAKGKAAEPKVEREPALEKAKSNRPDRPPRKEIGLDAETLRKVGELVEAVRESSVESDARASEVVRAIVLLVHEASHRVDYSRVDRRGQWGSPTARAFIAELREAYLRAVGSLYMERSQFQLGAHNQSSDEAP